MTEHLQLFVSKKNTITYEKNQIEHHAADVILYVTAENVKDAQDIANKLIDEILSKSDPKSKYLYYELDKSVTYDSSTNSLNK